MEVPVQLSEQMEQGWPGQDVPDQNELRASKSGCECWHPPPP
jgi:hypothetical protein